MSLSLLEIVQRVRGRLGQPVPASVAGNADPSILQSLGLLNEFLEDLVIRRKWQANTQEASFISIATASQGKLDTLFPNGYRGILPDTFYNRTTQLQIDGGISAADWQSRQATRISGPIQSFRIRNNELLLSPIPAAGEVYACEYYSSFFIYNSVDLVYREYWLKDTDTCVLGSTLPMAYLKWAWKKEKGLEYAEDFRQYEMQVANLALVDSRPRTLTMNDHNCNFRPAILVSPGSWPL